ESRSLANTSGSPIKAVERFSSSSTTRQRSIFRNLDLALVVSRSSRWSRHSTGTLEFIQHDYDELTFIPAGDYVVVEGTSRGKLSGKVWAGGDILEALDPRGIAPGSVSREP